MKKILTHPEIALLFCLFVGCTLTKNAQESNSKSEGTSLPTWIKSIESRSMFSQFASASESLASRSMEVGFAVREDLSGYSSYYFSAFQIPRQKLISSLASEFQGSTQAVFQSFQKQPGPSQMVFGVLVEPAVLVPCKLNFRLESPDHQLFDVVKVVHQQLAKTLWLAQAELCFQYLGSLESPAAKKLRRKFLAAGIPIAPKTVKLPQRPTTADAKLSNTQTLPQVVQSEFQSPLSTKGVNVTKESYGETIVHKSRLATSLSKSGKLDYLWSNAIAVPFYYSKLHERSRLRVEGCIAAQKRCSSRHGNKCQRLAGQCLRLAQSGQTITELSRWASKAAAIGDASNHELVLYFMRAVIESTPFSDVSFEQLSAAVPKHLKSSSGLVVAAQGPGQGEFVEVPLKAKWSNSQLHYVMKAHFSKVWGKEPQPPVSLIIRSADPPTAFRGLMVVRPLRKRGLDIELQLEVGQKRSRYLMRSSGDKSDRVARRSTLVGENGPILSARQLDEFKQWASMIHSSLDQRDQEGPILVSLVVDQKGKIHVDDVQFIKEDNR